MKHILAKLAIVAGLCSSLVCTGARAADPLGLYAGAGAGQAHLRINDIPYEPDFDATKTGWTAFVGLQPLPFLGAELQYVDFGHVTRDAFGVDDSARSLGIRAEYVRFRGPDGDPDLLSVALLWKF